MIKGDRRCSAHSPLQFLNAISSLSLSLSQCSVSLVSFPAQCHVSIPVQLFFPPIALFVHSFSFQPPYEFVFYGSRQSSQFSFHAMSRVHPRFPFNTMTCPHSFHAVLHVHPTLYFNSISSDLFQCLVYIVFFYRSGQPLAEFLN